MSSFFYTFSVRRPLGQSLRNPLCLWRREKERESVIIIHDTGFITLGPATRFSSFFLLKIKKKKSSRRDTLHFPGPICWRGGPALTWWAFSARPFRPGFQVIDHESIGWHHMYIHTHRQGKITKLFPPDWYKVEKWRAWPQNLQLTIVWSPSREPGGIHRGDCKKKNKFRFIVLLDLLADVTRVIELRPNKERHILYSLGIADQISANVIMAVILLLWTRSRSSWQQGKFDAFIQLENLTITPNPRTDRYFYKPTRYNKSITKKIFLH